jgi:hypothetical protein
MYGQRRESIKAKHGVGTHKQACIIYCSVEMQTKNRSLNAIKKCRQEVSYKHKAYHEVWR